MKHHSIADSSEGAEEEQGQAQHQPVRLKMVTFRVKRFMGLNLSEISVLLRNQSPHLYSVDVGLASTQGFTMLWRSYPHPIPTMGL